MQVWKEYQDKNKDRFLNELLDLLRIPSISAKSENKDESKDRTYYGNLKHFFDYINQIYDTQQITFSNICARNDTSGVFRTLSELVKFYLQCIKATTIPALSIGYNDDLLKEALIKHQSIDKDKVYLAQFHFKT